MSPLRLFFPQLQLFLIKKKKKKRNLLKKKKQKTVQLIVRVFIIFTVKQSEEK
jgi:hypothetical protein